MRGLILTDAVRQQVRDQAAWADRPENWYRPDGDQQPPGDNPAYTLLIEVGFRAVYTTTVIKGDRFRHLSISVDGPKYPNQIAAFTIATMFGFTGGAEDRGATLAPGDDWMMQVSEEEHCIIFGQKVGENV